MQVSVYDVSVGQFIHTLNAFKAIVKKGQDWSTAKKIEPGVFFETRLVADQLPLGKHIQIACDTAKFCAARLSGVDAPAWEDNEKTFAEFYARIDKTIGFLKEFNADKFKGWETRKVPQRQPEMYMLGKDYLTQHSIPNFYFHVTTVYSILRANGVDLGKKDYLGERTMHKA
jgi:hypothetical protein